MELDPPGHDGIPVGPGVWETSGIIDTSPFYGRDSWLFDVQAHPPTTAPAPNTVEDGQLMIMTPIHDDDNDDDDQDDDDDDDSERGREGDDRRDH